MSPATILLLFLAGLVVLPWDPALIPGPLQANPAPTPADQPIDDPAFERRVFMFPCSEEQCSAWLYLPKGVERPPVVVLAHGLGAQKDFGLGTYSEAFARNGIAAFVFDYRGFGGSTGEPRHWISPQRHLEDYRSAVAYIRSNLTHVVNPDQMVLWGTSLAGGHALVTAERLGSKVVKGVIAHVSC
jgi:alpha-beta hydrolase superfamily lysophospholipase